MTRLFIQFPTPGSDSNEGSLQHAEFTAKALGEQCIQVKDFDDVPDIPITQTRVSMMSHGHRGQFGFFESPDQFYHYLADLKQKNPHIIDIDLLSCNVGLEKEDGSGFAQQVAKLFDDNGQENWLCIHGFKVKDIYEQGGLSLHTSIDKDEFSLIHSKGLVEEVSFYLDKAIPLLKSINFQFSIGSAIKKPEDDTLLNVVRHDENRLETLFKCCILSQRGMIHTQWIDEDSTPVDLTDITLDRFDAFSKEEINHILENTQVTQISLDIDIPEIDLHAHFSYNYQENTALDNRSEPLDELTEISRLLRGKKNELNENNLIPLGKNNHYSIKNIRSKLEPFSQEQDNYYSPEHQATSTLFKQVADHRAKLEEDIKDASPLKIYLSDLFRKLPQKIENATTIRQAKENVLNAAANYLLEPTSRDNYINLLNRLEINSHYSKSGETTKALIKRVLKLAKNTYNIESRFSPEEGTYLNTNQFNRFKQRYNDDVQQANGDHTDYWDNKIKTINNN